MIWLNNFIILVGFESNSGGIFLSIRAIYEIRSSSYDVIQALPIIHGVLTNIIVLPLGSINIIGIPFEPILNFRSSLAKLKS